MQKWIIVVFLVLFSSCSVSETREISEEKLNIRYLSAAQMYAIITNYYPNLSLESANDAYLNLLTVIQNGESDFHYGRAKEILINSTLDLHNISYPTTAEILETGYLPVKLIYNEGQIYVKQINENSPIPLFSEIVGVNGMQPLEWFAEEVPSLYRQCNTNNDFNYLLKFLEAGYLGDKIRLDYLIDGVRETVDLSYEHNNRWIALNRLEKDIDYLYQGNSYSLGLIDDIIYIKSLSLSIPAPIVEELIEELSKDYYKVIIDLRENGGGFYDNGFRLIRPFMSNDFYTADFIYNYNYDDPFDYYKPVAYGGFIQKSSNSEKIEVETNHNFEVVVLIGQDCLSACEGAAYFAKQQENMTLMGENTGGMTAVISRFQLADGTIVILSIALMEVDGEYKNSIGIEPDIYIDFADMHLQEGIDIVLENAIDYLNNNR